MKTFCWLVVHHSPCTRRYPSKRECLRRRQGKSKLFCKLFAREACVSGNGSRVQVVMCFGVQWMNWHALEFHEMKTMKISCSSGDINFGENSGHRSTRIEWVLFQIWPDIVSVGFFQVIFFVARKALSLRCERLSRIDRIALSWFYRHWINYKLKLNFPVDRDIIFIMK